MDGVYDTRAEQWQAALPTLWWRCPPSRVSCFCESRFARDGTAGAIRRFHLHEGAASDMLFPYCWIKDAAGALDVAFVAPLAKHFGLEVFVETGTYRGDTLAAMRGLFSRLVSVELASELVQAARQRFAGDEAISIVEADAARGLAAALEATGPRPALIWLDAHYSGGPTAKGEGNTPILAEIDTILAQRNGRDVVLVDDARLFWPMPEGFLGHDTLEGYPPLSGLADRLRGAGYDVFVLGDALLAAPHGLQPSPTLLAATASRLKAPGSAVDVAIEQGILSAAGSERVALAEASALIEAQKAYGLGGHYFYWRGLLREAGGDLVGAAEDFSFAARCAVIPAGRAPARAKT